MWCALLPPLPCPAHRARLSVSPVSADEWSFILSLEKQPEPPKEKKKRKKKKADKDDEEEDEDE